MSEFALPKGTVLHSKSREYTIVEELGSGGFGITYKVSSTIMVDNVPITTFFAVKEHFMKGCYRAADRCTVLCAPTMQQEVEETRKDFIVEARRLNKLSGLSQNIVRVNEVFEDYGTAYYVMQYLDGGELSDHVAADGPMGEAQALSVIVPVARAVALIHGERLLHLDIKPENIVLMTSATDGTQYPVLIDFGIAKHFSTSGKPTSTPSAKGASDGYAPMEQYSSIDRFAPELDVYALGATLYTLLTGRVPRKAFDVTEQEIEDTLPPTVSKRTRRAIVRAMAKLKENRTPDVAKFVKSLEAEYTLPIGSLLHGPGCDYRVTGIHSEADTYIVYRALPAGETANGRLAANDATQSAAVAGGTQRKKTRKLGKTDNVSESSAGHNGYLVYELYVRNRYKRLDDGTVDGFVAGDLALFGKVKDEFMPMHDRLASGSLPLAEEFWANGTAYFSRLQVRKPSIFERLVQALTRACGSVGHALSAAVGGVGAVARRLVKPLLYLAGVAALGGGIFVGVQSLGRCSADENVDHEVVTPDDDTLAADSLAEAMTDTIDAAEDTTAVVEPTGPAVTKAATVEKTPSDKKAEQEAARKAAEEAARRRAEQEAAARRETEQENTRKAKEYAQKALNGDREAGVKAMRYARQADANTREEVTSILRGMGLPEASE